MKAEELIVQDMISLSIRREIEVVASSTLYFE